MNQQAVADPDVRQDDDVHTTMRVGDIKEGRNPRTLYDPKDQAMLEDGIRAANGVFTPILIRPIEGGHEMVAGYKRRRGAINVMGEDYQIPVVIRKMTDDEADRLATMENTHRAAMSAADEAEAAARQLGRCNGDREEAARQMGLSPALFASRLALMNCSEGVRRALTEKKILLGHAELFAAVPKDKQDKVLASLLQMPVITPVAQFKAQLQQISKSLETAIFNKDQCAGCQHNSGNQKALFGESIDSGSCTDGACFDKKTLAVLEAKKKELQDDFPRVEIVNAGDNFTLVKLVAEGPTGVGEEQAKQCVSCNSYGCAVSNVPGKVGAVSRGLCFDTACNAKCVSARLKAEQAAAAQTAKAKGTTQAKAAGNAGGAAKKSSKTTTTVQVAQRVIDYRISMWRAALKRELFDRQRDNLTLLIAVMMTRGGSNVDSSALRKGFETLTGQSPASLTDVGVAAKQVTTADDKTREHMLSGIVISMVETIDRESLVRMLQFMQVDLATHWQLNQEFLDLLTKSEMSGLADELGLKVALGDKFSKVFSGKNAEIIKALLAVEGFDYAGKIPSVLQYNAA